MGNESASSEEEASSRPFHEEDREEEKGMKASIPGLLFLFVCDDWLFFIVVTAFINGRDLERVGPDDLQVDATLVTLQCVAILYFIGIDVEGVIAFGANYGHGHISGGYWESRGEADPSRHVRRRVRSN